MTETHDVIVRLLRNLGSSREVEQYLKQFAAVDSQKFAVIKVGGGIIRDQLDDLASALTFLAKVGLFPIVVHGAGPQLDAALTAEGIESHRVDGMRVTDEATMNVARRVFQVTRASRELYPLDARAGISDLQALARETGGAWHDLNDAPEFPARVPLAPRRSSASRRAALEPVWPSPWVLLLMLCGLGGEWLLRRRLGVA